VPLSQSIQSRGNDRAGALVLEPQAPLLKRFVCLSSNIRSL
jgi:hypothetical protein